MNQINHKTIAFVGYTYNDNVDLIFPIATLTAQAAAKQIEFWFQLFYQAVTDPTKVKLVKLMKNLAENNCTFRGVYWLQHRLLNQIWFVTAITSWCQNNRDHVFINAEDNSIFQVYLLKKNAKRNLTVVR